MHKGTPLDSSNNNQTSLKNTIMRILSSNKKIKNQVMVNIQSGLSQSSLGEKKYELQLIETVAFYEMKEYPGYIGFKEWMKINEKFWGDKITIWAENLWKIMRLINQGQVIIPTGLVYQIIDCLISQPTQKQLKKVFQSFLSKNSKKDLSSCRQLKNYPSFTDIINGYSDNITKEDKIHLKEQKNTINLLVERISRVDIEKQRYLTQLRYQTLADEMKQCPFKPSINQYTSQNKRQRKQKKQKYDNLLMNQVREKQIIKNFKARPFDSKIFQNPLKPIPGVQKHIHRQQFCEQQRLRLKRFQQRSVRNYN